MLVYLFYILHIFRLSDDVPPEAACARARRRQANPSLIILTHARRGRELSLKHQEGLGSELRFIKGYRQTNIINYSHIVGQLYRK